MTKEADKKEKNARSTKNPSIVGTQQNPVSNPDIPAAGAIDPKVIEEMKNIAYEKKRKPQKKS